MWDEYPKIGYDLDGKRGIIRGRKNTKEGIGLCDCT